MQCFVAVNPAGQDAIIKADIAQDAKAVYAAGGVAGVTCLEKTAGGGILPPLEYAA